MKRYISIMGMVIGLGLALTGCGGGEPPVPEANTSGGDGTPVVRIPEDVQSLEQGAFFLDVSGGASFSTSLATYTYQPLADGVYELALTDATSGYSVVLHLYGVPESGDYSLQAYETQVSPEAPFAVGLFSLTSPQSGDRFSVGVSGTINFVVLENTITASFNFTANNDSGGSATVRGGFRELPIP